MLVNLCSIPELDINMEHVLSFENESNMVAWFNNKIVKSIDGNFRNDGELDTLVLQLSYTDIKAIDYIFFKGSDNKFKYYFVGSKKMKTESTCELNLILDLWTTYYWDWWFLDSYVERCHVPRWDGNIPTNNLLDDSFPLGEYMLSRAEEIYKYSDGMIISSTQPLGKCKGFNTGGSGGGSTGGGGGVPGGGGGNISKGEMSASGFRFIKGYEALAPYPYDDGFGYMTIGYGVTRHGEADVYNQLVAEIPVSEERAAKVGYQLKTQRYGLPNAQKFLDLGYTEINKFDALVSFCYNLGSGYFAPGQDFYEALKSKNETRIRNEWMNYVYAGGVEVEGLVLRRRAELEIFFNNKYEMRSIPILDDRGIIIGSVSDNNGNGWLPTS